MRSRSQVTATAWPAFADLMTILAIMGLAAAGIALFQDAKKTTPDDEERGRDPRELEKTVRDMRTENDRLTKDVARLTGEVARLTKDVARLTGENADAKGEIESLLEEIERRRREKDRDEVGFVPCWRGSRLEREGRTRRYYFTYRVTHRDERFRIEAHPDMAHPAVKNTVSGSFAAVLRSHPQETIDHDAFEEFASRIETARAAEYDATCLLAVTLNADAPVAIAALILKAKFYPVARRADQPSPQAAP